MDKEQGRERELRFFATAPKECSYLPGRNAISVFADPTATLSMPIYSELARFGFRRSGSDIYVPACPGCSQCIPVRIPVQHFRRSRNQQKIWNRNRDLHIAIRADNFSEEHFALYSRYLRIRHRGGGMDDPTPEDYMRFLTSYWSETLFIEFRHDSRLVAMAVTDRLEDALSAVYTFFDPALTRRSLGTCAILHQVELAAQLDCHWLYLGYWIPDCAKMQYKNRFRPLEAYRNGRWQRLGDSERETETATAD
jgi:arginine-tRNA-protein transferase